MLNMKMAQWLNVQIYQYANVPMWIVVNFAL
jgi:hypothetical protein